MVDWEYSVEKLKMHVKHTMYVLFNLNKIFNKNIFENQLFSEKEQ